MSNRGNILGLVGASCLAACTTQTPMRPLLQQVPFKDAALVSQATPEKSFRTAPDSATLQADQSTKQAKSQATDKKQDRLVYYRGETSKLPRLSGKSRSFKVKTLQLNFEAAPARDVATTVIAQALGLTVAVADGAEGTITLSSPEPLPVRAALDALETVLAESGLALIETGSGFMLTSLETAAEQHPVIERRKQYRLSSDDPPGRAHDAV